MSFELCQSRAAAMTESAERVEWLPLTEMGYTVRMRALYGSELPPPGTTEEKYLCAILEELQWARRRAMTPEERKAAAAEPGRARTFADHVARSKQP